MPSMSDLIRCPGSFRDSAGYVFTDGKRIFRTIQESFAPTWEALEESGLLKEAVKRRLLIPFKECGTRGHAWKTVESPLLPFVSYPYEWSFGQFKAAALLTLDLLDLALEHGFILRDASAYNVQFMGWRPIFIDLLSFEPWEKDKPWNAYIQFCRFFLAPLALMAKRSVECGRFLADRVEGLPLELASVLLPVSTRLSPSLALHIHYHAKLQKKFADGRVAAPRIKKIRLSDKTVPNLSQALRLAIEGLSLPASLSTVWGEYYTDTNYTENAARSKKDIINHWVEHFCQTFDQALDVGANTSEYSIFLTQKFKSVIGIDIDYLAIEKLWMALQQKAIDNFLPLVIDLCNPSPSIGWNNRERISFTDRCHVDYLSALAIIHHLVFTGGIPLPQIADAFSEFVNPGGVLLLEFVPKDDSQVQRLLAARENVSGEYSLPACLEAFEKDFVPLAQRAVDESKRLMLAFKKKG